MSKLKLHNTLKWLIMNNHDHLTLKIPNYFPPKWDMWKRSVSWKIESLVFKITSDITKTRCLTSNPPKKTNSMKHDSLKTKSSPGWCGSVVECQAANQRVTGSIPSQGACLGCRFSPWLGCIQEATYWCFSLISMLLSLPLPLSLSQINNF